MKAEVFPFMSQKQISDHERLELSQKFATMQLQLDSSQGQVNQLVGQLAGAQQHIAYLQEVVNKVGTGEVEQSKAFTPIVSCQGPDKAQLEQIKVELMRSDFYEALKAVNSQLRAMSADLTAHSPDQATTSQVAALQAQMTQMKQQQAL